MATYRLATEEKVEEIVAANAAGPTGYETLALLNADLTPGDGAMRYVTNDPTPANNGLYRKSGATGTGSWVQSSYDRVAAIEARTDEIEETADYLRQNLRGYYIGRSGLPVWTPLALMLAGEEGAWFDPTDLSTLYADTAFTTPAAVGDRVLGILDKSGNGHHLTQATSANAAYLRRDVQGIYYLEFEAGADTWYNTTTGGQWAVQSIFAAIRPSQIAAVRILLSTRSAAQVGTSFAHQNTARYNVSNGASTVTAVPEFPRPLLTAGGFSVIGGIYDGTNAVAYDDDFRGQPFAATHSVNTTPGFRVGAEKYFAPTTTFEGALYGLFIVDRAVSVEEAAAAYVGMSVYQEGFSTDALSATRAKIEAGAADVHVLVIGDSTGDAKTEWVYKVALELAKMYPRHGISYRLFNATTNAWGTAEAVQAGDLGFTIYLHNVSVSLSQPSRTMGDRYANAVEGLTAVDLVVWNHGHNISDTAKASEIRGEFLSAMEQVRQTWPLAHHAALLQNPRQNDTTQESKFAALRDIASDRTDLLLIDTRARFEAVSKALGYYVSGDPIHPSPAGSDLQVQAFMDAWRAAGLGTYTESAPWLDTTATNLLENGDFAAFAGATPDDWTLVGTPTLTKDTVVKDGADAYSLKIEHASAAVQGVSQALSSGEISTLTTGGTVEGSLTIALRLRSVAAYARSGAYQVLVTAASQGGTITYDPVHEGEAEGAFRWSIISGIPVPADTTAVVVRLLGSQAAVSGATTYFGRAVLVPGDLPRDMA